MGVTGVDRVMNGNDFLGEFYWFLIKKLIPEQMTLNLKKLRELKDPKDLTLQLIQDNTSIRLDLTSSNLF